MIINQLPQYAGDEEHLRIGDAGIRVKRWYIEGFERFNPTGVMTTCLPKGIGCTTKMKVFVDRRTYHAHKVKTKKKPKEIRFLLTFNIRAC
jgi:hypothetical protein